MEYALCRGLLPVGRLGARPAIRGWSQGLLLEDALDAKYTLFKDDSIM